MSIWFHKPEKERLAARSEKTMLQHLGIEITEVGDDFIRGTMPVDHRTHQPMGILHGGASMVLAETLGSIGANCCVDPEKNYCVGLEINGNHVRSVRGGKVSGCARPCHLGSSTHIWEVRIRDEEERLICISRITLAVLPHKRVSEKQAL
ncbi:MAG: hotdog fold thioesterase [Desulfococcaceae bacterium]|jgi:1,4-dihydroxy-2-naphthoyl-CoA hydrolase|nr:hotdog fold thioesterase [Desulfococcaceae bacterium]